MLKINLKNEERNTEQIYKLHLVTPLCGVTLFLPLCASGCLTPWGGVTRGKEGVKKWMAHVLSAVLFRTPVQRV